MQLAGISEGFLWFVNEEETAGEQVWEQGDWRANPERREG